MITNNVYINYETFNDKDTISKWLNDGSTLFSNHTNYFEESHKLIQYKEMHKKNYKDRKSKSAYNNIFAHKITFLIPYEVKKEYWNEFVKRFAESISVKYKSTKNKKGLLYIYQYKTVHTANYVELVCFTRKVYEHPKISYQKYNQDYYYDNQGKRVSANVDGAILKAKKGSYKTDDQGKRIRETILVKETEEVGKTFRYSDFGKFIQKFKMKWLKIAAVMTNREDFKVISRFTIKKSDSTSFRKTKQKLNIQITEINSILIKYQKSIKSSFQELNDDFQELLKNIDDMIHHQNAELKKVKEFIQSWWIKNIAEDWINA